MPEMDGFEFIKKIRRIDKEVNILAISAGSKGYSHERTLATAKDFGATRVLSKPFDLQEVLKVINELTKT